MVQISKIAKIALQKTWKYGAQEVACNSVYNLDPA